MKKSTILFFLFLSCMAYSQPQMPTYRQVMTEFFSTYEYERDYEKDIQFAKKKDGWYIQLINRYKEDEIIQNVLFWSNKEGKFIPQDEIYEKKSSGESTDDAIYRYTSATNGDFESYNYQRCVYYGYEGWDVDLINDFKDATTRPDTLLEGLARAYAFHAERYLWYGFGGKPYDNDSLKKILGKIELPTKNRLNGFISNVEAGVVLYKELFDRNPAYRMRVGNAKIKFQNEQFHIFQQLMIAGYDKESLAYLQKIEPDSLFKQIGYNYLNACAPNSILITFGDNDTYPLWYVQAIEKFREDVTVINYSLLGFAPYVDMLKRKQLLKFSAPRNFYSSRDFDYSFYRQPEPSKTQNLTIQQLLDIIHTKKYPERAYDNELIPSYPEKNITWKFDPVQLTKIQPQPGLAESIDIELSSYLTSSDLMVLDITLNNYYSRPVYFTSPTTILNKEYLQKEGILFRFLPVAENKQRITDELYINKSIAYISKFYKPLFSRTIGKEVFYAESLDGSHTDLFARIISWHLDNNKEMIAKNWAVKYLASFGKLPIPPDYSNIAMAELLLQVALKKEAKLMMEEYATHFYTYYKNPSPLEIYTSKEGTIQLFESMLKTITEYNLDSELIKTLIKELRGE